MHTCTQPCCCKCAGEDGTLKESKGCETQHSNAGVGGSLFVYTMAWANTANIGTYAWVQASTALESNKQVSIWHVCVGPSQHSIGVEQGSKHLHVCVDTRDTANRTWCSPFDSASLFFFLLLFVNAPGTYPPWILPSRRQGSGRCP